MRRNLFFALALTAVFVAGACQSKKANEQPAVDVAKKADAEGKAPKISAVESEYDFGKVKQGSDVEHVFKIRNTGTKDLSIKSARGS